MARRRHRHRHRLINPRRHRARRRYQNRRRHHRYRNPRRSGAGVQSAYREFQENLTPMIIGVGGATAVGYIWSWLSPSLPASLATGPGAILAKLAAAVGVGYLGGRFLGARRGQMIMLGGLTIVGYTVVQELLTGAPLGALRDFTPYPMRGLGAYIRGPTGTPGIQGLGRLGYVSPGSVIGPTMSPQMGAYMTPMNVAPALGDYGDGM